MDVAQGEQVNAPDDLICEQWEGVARLAASPVFMLADKVGFGKSAQFVRACDVVCPDPQSRIVVACPPNLRHNEAAEFARWGWIDRPVTILKDSKAPLPAGGVLVVSYALLSRREVRDRLVAWKPTIAICDEAHALKDPRSSRCRAMMAAGEGLAYVCARVWFVTGTPAPNHAGEWLPFALLSGAWRGSPEQFIAQFCTTRKIFRNGVPIENRVVGSKNQAELVELLRPYVLEREAAESERPPLEVDTFSCDGAVPIFEGLDPEELEAISEAVESGDWGAIKQLAPEQQATIRRVVGLAKAESVADLAAGELEADPELRTIIFCDHTATIDIIAARLAPFGVGVVDGRTPPRDREPILDNFRPIGTSRNLRVLVGHRRSIGEGQTLTVATREILAEPAWTPADNVQMIARAWRRGQRKPVRATFCYLRNTLDAAVASTLRRKVQELAALSFS